MADIVRIECASIIHHGYYRHTVSSSSSSTLLAYRLDLRLHNPALFPVAFLHSILLSGLSSNTKACLCFLLQDTSYSKPRLYKIRLSFPSASVPASSSFLCPAVFSFLLILLLFPLLLFLSFSSSFSLF